MSEADLIETILNKPIPLSPEQAAAVASNAKYNKVIAGAGAGKTEVLTRKIAYLLLVRKVRPSSIVSFTFTEKAAQSMKNRIYERVEQIAGKEATANLGEMYIGTIHGYAKRILEDHFGMGNFEALDENMEMAYILRHGWNIGLGGYHKGYSKVCSDFARTANMTWDEMIPSDILISKATDFSKALTRYEELLNNDRRLTFGKMMNTLVSKIQESRETLDRIRFLLVDEYQDVNRAQAKLIEIIGRHAEIFAVGDPRQSIYQWRGSDETFFRNFSEVFKSSAELTLKENRRSLPQIVTVANEFSDSFEEGKYDVLKPVRTEPGFVGLIMHESDEVEAQWVARQIERMMNANKQLKYSDFALLFRSVNTSGPPFMAALAARKIPFIVGGKVGLFKRSEAQALGRIFAWLANDGDGFWNTDPWNPRSRIEGDPLLTTGLELWIRTSPAISEGIKSKRGIVDGLLRQLKTEVQKDKSRFKSFTDVFQEVLNCLGYKELDPSDPNHAAIMANLGRFNNLLTDYEAANRLGGRSIKWAADLRSLCWFMNTYATHAYEEQSSDDIRGVDAVQIMTVHQAKGLEWPTVFIPSLVKRRFPSAMVGREQFWCDVPRDLFDAERYEGNVEDERRLFYVAITRARDVLILSYFGDPKHASPFISTINGNSSTTKITSPNGNLPDNIKPLHVTEIDEMQSFSAAEIIAYDICPQLYRFNELWTYQPALRQAMGYGNGLHFCLRRAGDIIRTEGKPPIEAVGTSVEENFYMPFAGGSVLENFKRAASKLLKEFAINHGEDLTRIEEMEYRVEFPVQKGKTKATIMGRVDVILKRNNEMEVRDYKTSDEARTLEQASVQVKLYTAGLKHMGKPVTSGSVAYLEGSRVHAVDVREEELVKSKDKAMKLIDGILNKDFKARPGEFCGKCDYAGICKWKN